MIFAVAPLLLRRVYISTAWPSLVLSKSDFWIMLESPAGLAAFVQPPNAHIATMHVARDSRPPPARLPRCVTVGPPRKEKGSRCHGRRPRCFTPPAAPRRPN